MTDLVYRALKFAHRAHADQVRKYTGEPYIKHPMRVARDVKEVGGTPEMIAAALLHDVVEDTPATIEDVAREFGHTVTELVSELTEPAHVGNRRVRKMAEARRLANISPEAQTIKLADLIDNTVSVVEHDPAFAPVYLAEKRAILAAMTAGDPALYARAFRLCWGEPS